MKQFSEPLSDMTARQPQYASPIQPMVVESSEAKAQAACQYFSLSISSPFEKLRRAQALEFEREFDLIQQEEKVQEVIKMKEPRI